MAHKAVKDAVRARILANWTEVPLIDMNNTADIPSDNSPFLVVLYPVATTRLITVNENLYEETGAFLLRLHVEKGSGTDLLHDQAQELASLFRRKTFSGIECRDVNSPRLDDDNERAGYFAGSVVVEYSYRFRE